MSIKKVDLVVGANYGDEGKGLTVARIAKSLLNEKIANVLTNGGAQRGHSVSFNNIIHIFHHFGSASPFEATTFYDRDFILDPLAFRQEFIALSKKFNALLPNAVRDTKCRWSTPFDSMYNQMESLMDWKGTCGMGIWATICRFNEMKNPTFDYFCEELSYDQKVQYLNKIKAYYENKWGGNILPQYQFAWYSKYLIEHFIDDCMFMYQHTDKLESKIINGFDHVIFENGQGLLLNDDGKDDPEKTPSQTGSNAIMNFMKMMPDVEHLNIHYVTRPYLTRHGSKNFMMEWVDGDLKKEEEINKYNDWQRKMLYANMDLNELKDRINKDQLHVSNLPTNISFTVDVTHCDELDRKKEFKKIFDGNFDLNFYGSKEV